MSRQSSAPDGASPADVPPGRAEEWLASGKNALEAGRPEAAAGSFRRALEIRPDLPEACFFLSFALCAQGRHLEALTVCDSALMAAPDDVMLRFRRASVLRDLRRIDEGVQEYDRALARAPGLLHDRRAMIDALVRSGEAGQALYYRNYLPDTTASGMLDWAKQYAKSLQAAHAQDLSWPNERDPGRPLRVGILSPDLFGHPVAYFLEAFLRAAQDRGVEWIAYASVWNEDETTRVLKPLFRAWRDIHLQTDVEAADLIRADRIDILIDLAGPTSDSRMGVLARKPAPVQINWLGYVGTTGLSTVDYIVGDRYLFPEGAAEETVEQPWRLPECYMSLSPPPHDIECGEPPLIANGYPTFGSFNNLNKINDPVLDLWARVMVAVPNARLLLRAKQFGRAGVKERLLARLVERGVDPARITLDGPLPTREAGLREYRRIDIALDTFPYTGATTSAEALWMGVPVIALKGNRMLARVGESLNQAVGLGEWIAGDAAQYVQLAARLAGDIERLRNIRKELRHRFESSSLGDPDRFAGHFVAALRDMWQRWCATIDAVPYSVPAPALPRSGAAALARAQAGYAHLRNLCDRGDFAALVDAATAFLAEFPEHGRAFHLKGFALLCLGRAADSIEPIRQSCRLLPDDAEVRDHLGAACTMLGRHDEAAAAFSEALTLDPARAETWVNASKNALDRGDATQAVEYCRKALLLRPGMPDAQMNMSAALSVLERYDEALAEIDAALRIAPDSGFAHLLRGNVLRDLRRNEESIAAYDRALVLDPNLADGWHGLVQGLCRLGNLDEAIKAVERARQLLPNDRVVLSTLASVYALTERHAEAEELLASLTGEHPDIAMDWLKLGNAKEEMGAPLPAIIACYERAARLDPAMESARRALMFHKNYSPSTTADEMLALATRYGELIERANKADTSWPNTPDPDRPLKVGFVSPDFCHHPVAFFLDGFLTAAQGKGIDWYAYASVLSEDETTSRFRPRFAVWRDVLLLSDRELAEQVRKDRIDILIDLTGHTSDSRLSAFARKPAPIQASWLGYVGTTGLKTIDYVIGDPWLFPEGQDSGTVEKPCRLPECFMSFTPPPFDLECGEPPMIANGYPVFGCFNNLNKVNDEVLALWSGVLAAVPEARLLMRAKQFGRPGVADSFRQRLLACGIDPSRVAIGGSLPTREAGLREYAMVDIALDPFPYTGATTSAEALWMGVPVLTMQGGRMLSRVGESLNRAVGLGDWIARDRADYVQRAARFARDPELLRRLRKSLRNRGSASPLGNPEWFANQFVAAMRAMWRQWCASQ